MRMLNRKTDGSKIYTKNSRKGEKLVGIVKKEIKIADKVLWTETKKVIFRKHKALPKGCKMPKKICIVCLKTTIHKNDSNYESKVCKNCTPSN